MERQMLLTDLRQVVVAAMEGDLFPQIRQASGLS